MEYLFSLILGGLAIYGAGQLINHSAIFLAHRRIYAWSQNQAQVKHLTGQADFQSWLMTLHESDFVDDVRLAISASVAACERPIDSLHNDNGKNRIHRLGQMLHDSWRYQMDKELLRRKNDAEPSLL